MSFRRLQEALDKEETQAFLERSLTTADVLEYAEGDKGTVVSFRVDTDDDEEPKFEYGGKCEVEFKFTNTGNEPLIIQKPKTSCGCTASSWPKEPILPGASDAIVVTYKTTTKVGNFSKSVTVTSNALVNNTVVLRIKGAILEQPTEALPEKDFGAESPVNNVKK